MPQPSDQMEEGPLEDFFPQLGFTPEELHDAMRQGYDKLIDFVVSPPFKALYAEMLNMSPTERPEFVKDVLLNPDELEHRGVVSPDGVLIQRSTFGDRRPTVFCVKTFLPERFHVALQNVNITFDNPHVEDVPHGEGAWREPLPVEVQSAYMADGRALQPLSDQLSVRQVESNPYPNPVLEMHLRDDDER